MKKSHIINRIKNYLLVTNLMVGLTASQILGQSPGSATPAEDFTMWYLFLFVLVILLIGAIYWRYRASQNLTVVEDSKGRKKSGAINADQEVAWLRKNGKKLDKKQDYKRYAKNGGKN